MEIPERVVVIRTYSVRALGEPDLECLREQGIISYLGDDDGGMSQCQLRVRESDAERARVLIGDEVSGDDIVMTALREKRDAAIVCPRCASMEVAPLRPYGLIVLTVGVVSWRNLD